MGYYEVAQLSRDMQFQSRVSACYALETRSPNAESWASQNMWVIASAPQFGEKYAYAVDTNVPDPGKDVGVISDGDILAVVTQLINEENSQP